MPRSLESPFMPAEREFIRIGLTPRFGQEPQLSNGLFLHTWQNGQPKIPKPIQTMLDRGLVEIRPNPMGKPAAFFTEAGLEGLGELLRNSLAMDHERFGYLRRALGLNSS